MTNLLIKISVSICLFIFSFLSSAYYLPFHHPYEKEKSACSNSDPICRTFKNEICNQFIPGYQKNWFSTCIKHKNDLVFACLNLPVAPYQSGQNTCHPQGSRCTCFYKTQMGNYIFETNIVYILKPGHVF